MSKFETKFGEIDEANPMIPLKVVATIIAKMEDKHCPEDCAGDFTRLLLEYGIPMHILAELDQEVGQQSYWA
jgi:hypothetical protein